jgi:glycosyltransferase involved in cell wall biosynthesis
VSPLAVLQVLPWYAPRSWGGTEQFVHSLCAALPAHGVRAEVAVLDDDRGEPAEHQGVLVRPIAGGTPEVVASQVVASAVRIGAPLVNLHAWTPLSGLVLVRTLRAAGLRCILNLHVPSLTCARGTMLVNGRRPCDGQLRVRRCTSCWLRDRGMPAPIAEAVAVLPVGIGPRLAAWTPHKRLGTALQGSAMMRDRIDMLASVFEFVDRFVVPAHWLADALQAAGVDPARLDVCRPGVDAAWPMQLKAADPKPRGTALQVLFVGRWDAAKGLDMLLDAVACVQREAVVQLTVCCAPPATDDACAERKRLLGRWGREPWLRVIEGAGRPQLAACYLECDVVAIPSRCMETGPIVALEALAAGCTVLGSELGGIRESLEGRPGCQLLPMDDAKAWANALRQIAAVPRRPRAFAKEVRDGGAVAAEMVDIYRRALEGSSA